MPAATLPFSENRYHDIHDLVARYKRCKAAIYADVKRGVFPAPLKLGGSARWSEQQLREFEDTLKPAPPVARPRGRPPRAETKTANR